MNASSKGAWPNTIKLIVSQHLFAMTIVELIIISAWYLYDVPDNISVLLPM